MIQTQTSALVDDYHEENGIYLPPTAVQHREAEYHSQAFDVLRDMQERHFWYRGRHRFLLHAVKRFAPNLSAHPQRVIDLGGGCGGWVSYLGDANPFAMSELGLTDSSPTALAISRDRLPRSVKLFHADLLNLQWQNRWDVAFLLDVLEHIPDDVAALRQIHTALAPGGLLFVTVPALQAFWSWNDELIGHQRRYTTRELGTLAADAGFELLDARYFMFFLSPLLFVSRLLQKGKVKTLSDAQRWQLADAMHKVPAMPINSALSAVFGAETPLGHWTSFPWGTSLLAVLRKPAESR
jgi:SAM-dependent methyltransferase